MLINRWYHRPKIHVPVGHEEKKPSWLELFYDLVYVAAIIQLGNGLSYHPGFGGFMTFAGLFFLLWYAWANFSFFYNRFNVDDAVQRLLVFAQMFATGGMAVSVMEVFEGQHAQFIISLSVARMLLALMYARAWRSADEGGDIGRLYAVNWGIGSVIWASSLLLPAPWTYLVWALAALIDLHAPVSQRGRDLMSRHPTDGGHLAERFGLLTIIVLGEMFVKVLTEVSDKGATPNMLITASLGLVITCSLWWLYFDDVAGSRLKKKPWANYVWIYVHAPLMMGITAVGVAIKKAVFFDPGYIAADKYRFLLCGVLGLTLVCIAIIDAVTERTHAQMRDRGRVQVRVFGALLVFLLAPAGAFMPAVYFLVLVATACVVQVLFDLAMAPERPEHAEHAGLFETIGGGHAPDATTEAPPKRMGIAQGENAIRLGTPEALRHDLYFRLMQGSWMQLIAMAGVAYLLLNVLFAALYMLDPTSIAGRSTLTFLDAFSFSVQTFTTVGFGGLTPANAYGDVLVGLEAFLGLIWVALVTGLMFSKAARPTSSIMFSEPMVVTEYNGYPTLMIRVANARGNSIVDAELSMCALVEEVSDEGHFLRRLRDVELARTRQPIFALSWTVMHRIDEDSPYYGLDKDNLETKLVGTIVTVIGHDETYAQTVHGRKIYAPHDIRFGHQFDDVMSTNDEGQLVLDFRKFHDTHAVDG